MAALFAVTNIVRIVGPIFGAVVGVIVVLTSTTDLKAMFGVLVVAIVVQILDNIVVLPLVMEGQVNIHPVFSMVGVLAGGAIAVTGGAAPRRSPSTPMPASAAIHRPGGFCPDWPEWTSCGCRI